MPRTHIETKTSELITVDLGPEASLTSLPMRLLLENRAYYLVHTGGAYQLFATVCPHQGGGVVNAGAYFECPMHGWRFQHDTGECMNTPNQRLASIPVTLRQGHLTAEVPRTQALSTPVKGTMRRVDQLTIRLHAHACLDIAYKASSVLFDPWLCGPAFLGAWIQYPPPVVDIDTLRPTAIVVTHEHSDHFHEPTLMRFDRATPIYFPDFPNRRLLERLAALGFSKAHPMPFGEAVEVAEGVRMTCFEAESLWDDAIILAEIEDFRLLNLNDAGLNHRIANMVAPVDVVASQFSSGASGYPFTWRHLTDTAKISIHERACRGKLQLLHDAATLYRSKAVLPFASHFALWHPSHLEYARMMTMNTLDDVAQAFDGRDVRVIDILPGESWDVSADTVRRLWRRRDRLYDPDRKVQYLQRQFNLSIFRDYYPTSGDLTRSELEAYFLGLNETPEVALSENLTVRVRAAGDDFTPRGPDVSFQISQARLRILPSPPTQPNVVIDIPTGVLKHIITENLPWDEAHIGYWCRFSRSPDVYRPGFWRLLQAPSTTWPDT